MNPKASIRKRTLFPQITLYTSASLNAVVSVDFEILKQRGDIFPWWLVRRSWEVKNMGRTTKHGTNSSVRLVEENLRNIFVWSPTKDGTVTKLIERSVCQYWLGVLNRALLSKCCSTPNTSCQQHGATRKLLL